MFRSLKLLITGLTFLIAVAISLAATVAVVRRGTTPPPAFDLAVVAPALDPPPAAEEELRRALTAQDVAKEPRERQLALAGRLEELARSQRDWRGLAQNLTKEEQRRAQENVEELVRVWFISKAEQYAALDSARQTAYVDGLIDTTMALAVSAQQQAKLTGDMPLKPNPKAKPRIDAQAALGALLARWAARTSKEESFKALMLAGAIQRRIQARAPGKSGKVEGAKSRPLEESKDK